VALLGAATGTFAADAGPRDPHPGLKRATANSRTTTRQRLRERALGQMVEVVKSGEDMRHFLAVQ